MSTPAATSSPAAIGVSAADQPAVMSIQESGRRSNSAAAAIRTFRRSRSRVIWSGRSGSKYSGHAGRRPPDRPRLRLVIPCSFGERRRLLAQNAAQRLSPVVKVRPRCPHRDPEDPGDFRVIVSLQVVHHDGRPLPLRKLFQRREHPTPRLASFELPVRIVARGRRIREFGMRPQPLSPPQIQTRTPQHAIKPRAEAAPGTQLSDSLQGAYERGLHRVLRILLVA